MTAARGIAMNDNVRKIRPGEREELEARITLLVERQGRRREAIEEQEQLIVRRQLEIDNLRARLEQCDE